MSTKKFNKQIPDYTTVSMNRMFNALDEFANKKVIEHEKAVLDSIEILTNDAKNFDSNQDFENVIQLIDDLEDNWMFSNPVVKSNLDAHKQALSSLQTNFQTNEAIENIVFDTRNKLINLNEETSAQLPALLADLDSYGNAQLKHANANSIKILNDLKDDIRRTEDIAYSAEKFAKDSSREIQDDIKQLEKDLDLKLNKALNNPLANMSASN